MTTMDDVKQDTKLTRDLLALERTKLANERTLLAYIRTSMTFFAGAAALIEFFHENQKLAITAYISIVVGVILLLLGIYHYYQTKQSMKSLDWSKK